MKIDFYNSISEAYSEPCAPSKTDRFAKVVNGFQLLTIFAKYSILDVWQSPEYVSAKKPSQPAITCSKLTIESLEQNVKCV